MPYTDAQKRARNNYESAHYTVIGCKVRKEYAEQFRAACYDHGTNPAEVFKKAIAAFLAEGGSSADVDNATAPGDD